MLGAGFGLAVTIGNTIGAGILRTPGEVAALLPTLPLCFGVWVAGGVFALLGATSHAELGAAIPRSGGQYVFAWRAFGASPGVVVRWNDWVSTCASTAAVAIAIGEYLAALVPALAGGERTVAILTILAFAVLQWRGAFAPVAERRRSRVCSVIFTDDGWIGVLYFAEEVRDPGRDIPRSMLGGILLIIGPYLLLNAAFVHLVPLAPWRAIRSCRHACSARRSACWSC